MLIDPVTFASRVLDPFDTFCIPHVMSTIIIITGRGKWSMAIPEKAALRRRPLGSERLQSVFAWSDNIEPYPMAVDDKNK